MQGQPARRGFLRWLGSISSRRRSSSLGWASIICASQSCLENLHWALGIDDQPERSSPGLRSPWPRGGAAEGSASFVQSPRHALWAWLKSSLSAGGIETLAISLGKHCNFHFQVPRIASQKDNSPKFALVSSHVPLLSSQLPWEQSAQGYVPCWNPASCAQEACGVPKYLVSKGRDVC